MTLDQIQCSGSIELEVGIEKTTAGFDLGAKLSVEARFGCQSKDDAIGLARAFFTGFKHMINLVKWVYS